MSHLLTSSGALQAFLNVLFICGITLFLKKIGSWGSCLHGFELALLRIQDQFCNLYSTMRDYFYIFAN